jgi:hypothetical protein
MVLYLLYLAGLLFSAIIAIINKKALESRQLSFFIPYLTFIFLQELGVFIFSQFDKQTSTGIVYNISRLIVSSSFAYIFYSLPVNFSVRKYIMWLQTIYLAIAVVTYIFIAPIKDFNRLLSSGSGLVITIYAIIFLINFFNLDNSAEEYKWSPVTWIAVGVVVFYPVVNISLVFYKEISKLNANILGTPLFNAVPRLMSIFMYGCFAYAFYLCKKKN